MDTSPSTRCVLLIEDDRIDQEYFRRVIKGADRVDVTTAQCLHDGIQLIRESHFDAVLFDLGLPDSYGLDTVKRMTEEFADLPLIVLTGTSNVQIARDASEYGLFDYLVKGQVTAAEIIGSVHSAIRSNGHDHDQATEPAPESTAV